MCNHIQIVRTRFAIKAGTFGHQGINEAFLSKFSQRMRKTRHIPTSGPTLTSRLVSLFCAPNIL